MSRYVPTSTLTNWYPPLALVSVVRTALVPVFVSSSLAIGTKAPDGSSVLHMAAQAGNLEMIRALANAGAKLDITNNDGLTALDIAEGKRPAGAAAGAAGARGAGPRGAPPAVGGGPGRGGRGGAASPAEVAAELRKLMGLPPAPPKAETSKTEAEVSTPAEGETN